MSTAGTDVDDDAVAAIVASSAAVVAMSVVVRRSDLLLVGVEPPDDLVPKPCCLVEDVAIQPAPLFSLVSDVVDEVEVAADVAVVVVVVVVIFVVVVVDIVGLVAVIVSGSESAPKLPSDACLPRSPELRLRRLCRVDEWSFGKCEQKLILFPITTISKNNCALLTAIDDCYCSTICSAVGFAIAVVLFVCLGVLAVSSSSKRKVEHPVRFGLGRGFSLIEKERGGGGG